MSCSKNRFGIATGLAAASFVACLMSTAAAAGNISCPNPCTFPNGGAHLMDYTVDTTGHTYRWDFRATFNDTGESLGVIVGQPTQIDGYATTFGGDVTFVGLPPGSFTWRQVYTPTLTSYYITTPKSFDNCAESGPADAVCSVLYIIWGNGTWVDTPDYGPEVDRAWTLNWQESVVPEPATWAMMIAGFGLVGAVTRRSRRLAAL